MGEGAGQSEGDTFAVGRTYACARPEGGSHPATVVRKRPRADGGSDAYVHYLDLDRRLDEWVPEERLGEELVVLQSRERRRRFGAHEDGFSASAPAGAHAHAPPAGGGGNSARARALSEHAQLHELTKVRNINRVQLGRHEIDCWYYSPYPGRFGQCDKLYVCEATFKYFGSAAAFAAYRESAAGRAARPPGRRVYSDPSRALAVFCVDGAEEALFGQCLCLFGKLFIEHKTLSFDPAPFFFYVVYEEDAEGLHPVGYFSKEKESKEAYNLACIVALPPFQRKGYGKFIISLSYEVTKRLGEVGSPEKPLSDLGKLSYRSYWSYVLLDCLDRMPDDRLSRLTLHELSRSLGVKQDDVLSTMQSLKMIYQLKGQLVVKVSRDYVRALLLPLKERRFADKFCNPDLLDLGDNKAAR